MKCGRDEEPRRESKGLKSQKPTMINDQNGDGDDLD